MAKIFTLFILSCCTTVLHAQINKGAILLGGQLGSDHTTSENRSGESTSKGIAIDLSVGRAFRENSVLGLSLSYAPHKQTTRYNTYLSDTATIINKAYGIGAGAFFRRYKDLGKDFYFFTQVSGGTNYRKARASEEEKETQLGVSVQVTPGISYQVFRRMQMEVAIPGLLGLYYSKTKKESKGEQTQESRHISLSSNFTSPMESLGVGFRFIF